MNAAIWSAIISGLTLVAVAVLTNRSNKKGADATNALQERVVDREDFQLYTERQDRERERLEQRIADLENRLEAEVTAREKAEERAAVAEKRANAAEKKATELERRVTQLEQENEKLRDDLLIATRLLEQKYPDDQPDLD